MSEPVVGVDIGGTKIAVGLVGADGALAHAATRATPPDGTAEQVWRVVDGLISEALAAAGGPVRGVGIGSGGPIHLPEGAVSPINIPGWRRFPIRDRVAAAVPGVPVRVAGDGLCLALAEHRRGAGRGARSLLGMVVSTGVGGGLLLDGRPYAGRTGNAGHVGHVVVELDGEPCGCGARGCVETVASGPRMVRWARGHGWLGTDARSLAQSAGAGDPVAVQAFGRAAKGLAATIASVAAVCDLDVVVIGGGVATAGPLLFDPLNVALGEFVGLDFLSGLRVVAAEFGRDAGLVGAGALVDT